MQRQTHRLVFRARNSSRQQTPHIRARKRPKLALRHPWRLNAIHRIGITPLPAKPVGKHTVQNSPPLAIRMKTTTESLAEQLAALPRPHRPKRAPGHPLHPQHTTQMRPQISARHRTPIPSSLHTRPSSLLKTHRTLRAAQRLNPGTQHPAHQNHQRITRPHLARRTRPEHGRSKLLLHLQHQPERSGSVIGNLPRSPLPPYFHPCVQLSVCFCQVSFPLLFLEVYV